MQAVLVNPRAMLIALQSTECQRINCLQSAGQPLVSAAEHVALSQRSPSLPTSGSAWLRCKAWTP